MVANKKRKIGLKHWFITILLIVLPVGGFAFQSLPPKGFIPVLMYHFILPDVTNKSDSLYVNVKSFDQQMWFLKTFGFRPISVSELDRIKSGQEKAKGKEVVVTFDDGHKTFIPYALPVLERYQIPAINFLIWNYLLKGRAVGSMTLEEALSLKSHPLVTVGAHTMNHFFLTEIDPKEAKIEIAGSKKELEKAFGRPIDYFCYPTGAFNDNVVKLVEEAGYRMAFTAAWKVLKGRPETRFTMTRMKIGPRDNLLTLWFKISGIRRFLLITLAQLTPNHMDDKLVDYQAGVLA